MKALKGGKSHHNFLTLIDMPRFDYSLSPHITEKISGSKGNKEKATTIF